MDNFSLRPYQQQIVDNVLDEIRQDHGSVAIGLATGAGKTVIAAAIALAVIDEFHPIFISDRIVLVSQTVKTFQRHGMKCQILQGENTNLLGDPDCTVGTIQTISSRCKKGRPFLGLKPPLFIIDETHIFHTAHQELLDQYPDSPRIGMSATLERKGLGDIYGTLVRGPSIKELIEDDYLTPFICYGPTEPDLAKIKTTMSANGLDYDNVALGKHMTLLVGDILKSWSNLAKGLKTIIFATNIAHACAISEQFDDAGIISMVVSHRTPLEERDALYEAFRKGELTILISVEILALGFDEPSVECVVQARPTKSLTVYIQQVGRGSRCSYGKKECIVIDHCGNIARHGFPQDYIISDLRPGSIEHDNSTHDTERVARPCSECSFLSPPDVIECPNCGHRNRRQCHVTSIDADLEHLESKVIVYTSQDPEDFYYELLWYAVNHVVPPMSKKPMSIKAANSSFKARYGYWPDFSWQDGSPISPTQLTINEIKRQRLAFFKSLKKAG